jgi:hypothetical protein
MKTLKEFCSSARKVYLPCKSRTLYSPVDLSLFAYCTSYSINYSTEGKTKEVQDSAARKRRHVSSNDWPAQTHSLRAR